MKFTKTIECEIKEATCKPGETFTIWLDIEKEKYKRNAIQVELRVKKDGVPEIFTHTEKVQLQDFENWVELK